MDFPIRITRIIVASFSLLLHFLGVYSIYAYKKKTNQNIILCSLSVAEIIPSIQTLIYCFVVVSDLPFDMTGNVNHLLNSCVYYVGYYGFMFGMFILTFDRLVCVSDPLKYQTSRQNDQKASRYHGCDRLVDISIAWNCSSPVMAK